MSLSLWINLKTLNLHCTVMFLLLKKRQTVKRFVCICRGDSKSLAARLHILRSRISSSWVTVSNVTPENLPPFCWRALEESLKENQSDGCIASPTSPTSPVTRIPPGISSDEDEQLRLALELSQRELEEQRNRHAKETEELERIMELSLLEK